MTGNTPTDIDMIADAAKAWEDLPPDVEERRMQVRDLLRHGLTHTMIARLVGAHRNTIARDVAWLRKAGQAWAERFVDAEEIGEAAALFQEVENRSMKLASVAESPFDHTEEVSDELVSGGGAVKRRFKKLRVLIDHAAVANHLRNAMAARVQKHEMLRKAGMMKVVDLNLNLAGRVDVGRLSDEQLRQVFDENCRQLAEIRTRIKSLTKSNPLEGPEKETWED
jgi:hypothetical protein